MLELTFAEKMLVMKLIEKAGIESDLELHPIIRDFYHKLQKAEVK